MEQFFLSPVKNTKNSQRIREIKFSVHDTFLENLLYVYM
jgi:hypothetical protein